VASAEAPAAPDSTALDAGGEEDLRNRMRWISEYVAKGQLDDAASWCDGALKVFPQRAEIWNDLGVVRKLKGDWAGALTAWNQALGKNARLPAALYNRAVFERFYLLNRPAARRDFERFLAAGVPFDETLADRMAEERKP
jgi:tetratricopeptide (TPR) repeat protein